MKHFGKAATAGFIATVVLSALMVMKNMMGIMPELDIAKMISGMMGMPLIVGWLVHFTIGTLGYGAALSFLDDHLPGQSHVMHGIILALGGWLVMMVMLMPMAGAGFFGMTMGIMAPMMTLVLHLIFGAVLGWYYKQAIDRARPAAMSHG
ncbi:MAG TPA: DUF6789 family protein [Ramlibacter sp.]